MNSNAESPETNSPIRILTVVLVDDQLFIREVVRRMLLEQPDIDYHYFTDSSEAIRRIKEIQPDVILQDLVIPGVDGIELVRYYRAQEVTRSTRVILLSSSGDADTRGRAFAAGVDEFMVKPPSKAALLGSIRFLTGSSGKTEKIAR